MFEDRTQDTIMKEMLSQFGADVRTDEGSLAYNSCARIGSELEDVYADMDELNDNMLPDTQDLAHLIQYSDSRGVAYKYATAPVVKGVFQQEIGIGERFTCGEYIYTVSELIEGYTYKLQCETEGTEANTTTGELSPVDYIDDYLGGTVTEILVLGVDDEDEEAFRKRVINSFSHNAFGGNKEYYQNAVNEITGVGGCKPKRREVGSEYINIWIIASDYMPASDTLVSKVQAIIDPEMDGEGDGKATINHIVQIKSAVATEINVRTTVTWENGYGVDTSKSKIDDVIDNYLLELRKAWQDAGKEDTVVRIAQIDARILAVEGVSDVKDTQINGTQENLSLTFEKLPVYGGVTIV